MSVEFRLQQLEARRYWPLIGLISVALFVVFCLSVSAQQIMSPEAIARIEAHLPRMEPGFVRDTLESPDKIWYDRDSMGIAFQAGAGTNWNLPFASTGRLGIANGKFLGNINTMEQSSFPWNPAPGGTHRSPNVDSVKCFVLPRKPDSSFWPVIVFKDELEGFFNPTQTVTGLDWLFPIGAKFVEPITVNDEEAKQHYICIVRGRLRLYDSWEVESMAPFRTEDELIRAIVSLRPDWLGDPTLVSFVTRVPHLDKVSRLSDTSPGNRNFGTKSGDAFNKVAVIDILPALDKGLIGELLDTTEFKSSAGYEWLPNCNAPTAKVFHVVPEEYDGAYISIDSTGCANCHNGTQISARRHDPNNGKKGWVRGNKEGIISWHPFEPSSLTPIPNPNVKLRQKWVDAGVVAFYDPERHPKSVYRRLTKVSH